jgi:UDP-glucose 4-epimerase
VKFLITGGAGYIGSHVVFQLVEAGHDVTVFDSLYSGHRWAVTDKARLIVGDVGDRDAVAQLLSSETWHGVMHFAAYIEVEESTHDPAKYYWNNTACALNLMSLCVQHGIRNFIFSSTAAVYGEPNKTLVTEDDAMAPINPYGASKMMAERFLIDLCEASRAAGTGSAVSRAAGTGSAPGFAGSQAGMRYVILRYFNVAGARLDARIGQATRRSTHLVKIASEAVLGVRPHMGIFGTDYPTADGTCERDYIHVEDLASAHLAAFDYLVNGGESTVFNVGYGRPYSVRTVIDAMKEVSGVDFKVLESPRRPGDSAVLAADTTKIRRTLPTWQPKYDDIRVICRTALAWERALQNMKSTGASHP